MDIYIVTSKKSKIGMVCNEPSDIEAKKLYKSILNIRLRKINCTIANTFNYLGLKDFEYVIFTDFQKVSDIFAKLESYRLATESFKKANAEMHLNCKFMQEQNRRLQAEVQEQKAQIIELKKRAKSTSEKVSEKVKEATAKKVASK